MLITLFYHSISPAFKENFIFQISKLLSKNISFKLPGDKLDKNKINLSLTFDDGYFDFYHVVFPILKKFKIKATLAICPKYIEETTSFTKKERIKLSLNPSMDENLSLKKPLFCTWEEIQEMVDTNLVSIASHSYSHKNLLDKDTNLDLEIVKSKHLIEEKIKKNIQTFVYPFGKFNKKIHNFTKNHYDYILRIGNAININWKNLNKIIYRIDGEKFDIENKKKWLIYFFYYILNSIRKR